MAPVLLGLLVLIALVAALRGIAYADPKLLKNLMRYGGVAALGALAVFLAVIDRWPGAVFIGGLAWSLYTGGRFVPLGWPMPHFPGGGAPDQTQTSTVRTTWLAMELDHASGEMQGKVLKGVYAGRALADLDRDALLVLHRDAADTETARLLEAYLDRRLGPDWRAEQGARRSSGAMSRKEALKVLGLAEGASADDIRATHKRLMLQNHPDRGGSDYLASKINEAKDVLLG